MEKEFLRLLFGNQGFKYCEKIYALHTRLPKFFPAAFVKQIIFFLSCLSEPFLNEREESLIFRLLISQYKLGRRAEKSSPPDSLILTRVLSTEPFICRLVIAVSHLGKYESFTKEHLLQGIQHLISGVKGVKDSYLSFTKDQTHFFYLEIKKMRGVFFSKEEVEKLNTSLAKVLKEKIEFTFKSIVLPDIEENLFKHITQLGNELTSPNDIPQIMIFFSEYSEHKLTFFVIFLRVLNDNAVPLTSFISQSPSSIKVFMEKNLVIGFIEKKYPKEASIFKIQLNPSLCIHEKKVNLRAARQYIKKILENVFGQIRDFNGGLIIKEEEQLEKIKQACKQFQIHSWYFEDLFYNIQPSYMRALMTTQTGLHLLQLLEKILDAPISEGFNYCYDAFSSEEAEFVIVKTNNLNWNLQIPEASFNSDSQVGYSHLQKEGFEYHCFFEQFNQTERSLLETIKKHIEKINANREQDSKNVLRLNLQGGDPSSLNPRLASDIHCHTLCSLLFEGLTKISPMGEPEPALAKKIEVSSSGLEYIFHLRVCAWSNGVEVTAHDFERSWKKALMDSVPSFLCPKLFFHLENAQKAREKGLSLDKVGVVAKDRKTLWVKLEKACPYFLHLLATPLFFPLYGDSEEPQHFNGAFYLENWKHNHLISLSRNPFYWNSNNIPINGIKFHMEEDPNEIYSKFLHKELDVIGDPLSPLSPIILKNAEIKLLSQQISRIFWIHCNRNKFPLNHRLVRQALNRALNRKKIASEIFYEQIPHSSPLPRSYSDYPPNLEGEPELAESLFENALKELKLKRSDFPPLELIHSNLAFEKSLARELKRQWKETLGIRLVTKELPWSDFSSALEKGEFQLGGLFRRDIFNHPKSYLSFFQSSSTNPHSLNSPAYDKLFNRIDQESDSKEALKHIEKLLIEEAAVFPLISQVYFGLVQKHITGISWSANGCINLNKVSFNENA